MEVRQRGLIAGILMATLAVAPLAEAKRAGGGKSHGMSRSSSSSQSYSQPRQVTPAQQPTQASQQRSGSGVGKMVAAGVAGAAVGAVAANAMADDRNSTNQVQTTDAELAKQQAAQQEQKGGIPSCIWLILIAGAAFFLFRKFGAKKKLATNNPYAPNSTGSNAPFGQANTTARSSN
ncbi:MAG: Tim44 domain-containing protein, partial [Acinetobacter sp.]